MRLRLLVDVEVTDETRAKLAEMLQDQPTASIQIKKWKCEEVQLEMDGRFMGAQVTYG
jgi:hypothetical protein